VNFVLGAIVGFVFGSLLWALYIAFFRDEATAFGMRFRRWIRKKFNLS
jgi:L-asparagine transporter-like permease